MSEPQNMDDEDIKAFDLAQAQDDGAHVPHNVVKRLIDGENPVKVYREWRDLTQEALAEKAGVSAGYVSQIERGTRRASRKKLLVIAEILGVAFDDLAET
ncbi:helix-turn-helix transcriptional regulator [Varunaivibrio sulfuroxidans]|uniref:DNA-binding XRE family transcriptional regulator n=1 Tax=Varunaivibrio sulfuroxidans TaxID=1773489 RepID=A0A4R3J686_9PROT|nr:helix-turn-helix transcriptional regulator [Varunaivibrio sulfuroxidans]TCS59950.1 DNA-binding XRE family transcriptional regulator [Varunaivibrio sulfuroxidans]WES31765.1 helix-turn-helix transcriptional regulator [Varunaivibrio sulfuroxidans]